MNNRRGTQAIQQNSESVKSWGMSEQRREQAEEGDVLGCVWKVQRGHQGFTHTELGDRRGHLPYLVMFDNNE